MVSNNSSIDHTVPDTVPQVDGDAKAVLSVIVPAYNEETNLPELYKRLAVVLEILPYTAEIIFVNDGSTDQTLPVIRTLSDMDPRIVMLDLSRNFGKEIAMTAGLDRAKGDAVVIIDADLQHPPELIPEMIRHWLDGYDVVYAQRISRSDESPLKRFMANAFYNFMQRISHVSIPEHSGDFRLLSRRAVDSVKGLREHHRFMKGLFAWIGYRQRAVPYNPEPRFAGRSKWNYWRLWNFAIEGITSFTTAPLKIATYMGVLVALLSFCYGLYIIIDTLVFGNPVKGYPSLLTVMLFLGGVQLIFIGIIGEYVGRMFDETKNRPLYFLNTSPATVVKRDDTRE